MRTLRLPLLLSILFSLVSGALSAQGPVAGDIAFVQYNADGTDNFGFVALVPIPAGTEISFTDNEPGDLTGGEGTITWTAPAGGLACGSVVIIDVSPSANVGTVTEAGSLNFAANGDGLWAYTGSAGSPAFIAALGNDGSGGSISTTSEGDITGTGLTEGTDAVGLNEVDNARYDGSLLSGTRAALLAAINDRNNWDGDNAANLSFSGTFTVTDCAAPGLPEVAFSVSADTVSEDAGSYTLTVVSTATGAHTVDVAVLGGSAAAGTDYVFSTATATFSGSTTWTGTVSLPGNTICDGPRQVRFGLSDTAGCLIAAPDSLVLTLSDNDATRDLIAAQGFETGDAWGYAGSGAGSVSTDNSGASLRIRGGSRSWQVNDGLGTLTLDGGGSGIDVSDASGVQFELWFGAGNTGTPYGMTDLDYVAVELSESGSFTGTHDVLLYGPTTGALLSDIGRGATVRTTAGNPVSDSLSTAAGRILVDVPDAWETVHARVTAYTSYNDLVWSFDHLALTGERCGAACGGVTATLATVLDNYPEETSWSILDQNGALVAVSPDYSGLAGGTSVSANVCLPGGCYVLQVHDAYGDGMCCAYGSGSYSLVVDGTTVASGGSFTALDSTGFCVADCANPEGVRDSIVAVASGALGLGWSLPGDGCAEEVLVVARSGSAVTAEPSGDGSAYTADAAFGGGTDLGGGQYAVYRGSGTGLTVSALDNGTTYHFAVFARADTAWSAGAPLQGTPNTPTELQRGDLAIVAVNTQAEPSGGSDEICFCAFREIGPTTAIDLTDNGYERQSAGLWGDTEGTLRLRRDSTAAALPAGSVVCLRGAGNDEADYNIRVNGQDDGASWTLTSLNGGFSLDLNGSDQLWFLQGGEWIDSTGSHDARYTGRVLYGWTATGWESAPGYASTVGSTLPAGLACYSTSVQGLSGADKAKYTGPLTDTTWRQWMLRVDRSAFWTGHADNAAYATGGTDFWGGGATLGLVSGSVTPGRWLGANTDWYDCSNWDDLTVPDSTVSVTIDAAAAAGLVIDTGSVFANGALNVAGLTLDRGSLTLRDGAELRVYGNLVVDGSGTVAFDTAATLVLHGDFDNRRGAAAVDAGAGTVRFAGGGPQTWSVGEDSFGVLHHVVLDKAFRSVLDLGSELRLTGTLTLEGGIVDATAHALSLRNAAAGAVSGFEPFEPALPGIYANDAYVQGTLERQIDGAGSYDFPVGAGPSAEGYARVRLDVTAGSGLVRARYVAGSPGIVDVNTVAACGGQTYDVVYSALNDGLWRFAQTGGTPISYAITAYPNEDAGLTAPSLDGQYRLLKAPSGTEDWTAYALDGDPCTVSPGYYEVTGAGYTGFSDFAIGGGGTPLPVTLVSLEALPAGDAVAVSWHTAAELNSDHFTVERSADGLAWTALGQVAAAGWSTEPRAYAFLDELPLAGLSYYRLVQVDRDGGAERSAPVAVQRDVASALSAWPNPTAGAVRVAGTTGAVTLELVDLTGRVRGVFAGTAADLSGLPAGAYWLRVRDDAGVRVLPLHKR